MSVRACVGSYVFGCMCECVRACVRIRTYSTLRTHTYAHSHPLTHSHTHSHTHNKGGGAYQQLLRWDALHFTFVFFLIITHRHTLSQSLLFIFSSA